MSRYAWLKRIVYLNTFGFLYSEASEALLAKSAEKADLREAGLPVSTVNHVYREHYLNTPMGNDYLYFLTRKKHYIVRDRMDVALLKDSCTFLILGVFLPRLAFGLGCTNQLLRLLLDLQTDPRVVEAIDWVNIGRVSRLLMLVYPAKYFI